MIDGVIFDFDGVIIDSEPIWEKAKINAFQVAGFDMSCEQAAKGIGKQLKDFVAENQHQFAFDDHSATQLVKNVHQYALDEISRNATPMKGIYEAVDYLLSHNKKLAIASSASSLFIKKALNSLNLQNIFTIICSAEHEEYAKPHPAVYIAACKRLGLSPLNAMAIEDSLTGLISAKAARMPCILIKHPDERLPCHQIADKIIMDLSEIKDLSLC